MTLLNEIVGEIQRDGPITFSRYMELALYHPTLGFYASGGAGRRRDFITSPEVGPLFGAVVARALDSWWDELGQPDPFSFVDAGAGPGTLARSILKAQPRCAVALDYIAVEISDLHRGGHPDGVTSLGTLPRHVPVGVIFANELLDNLPFDLLSFVDGRGWREVRLGVSSGDIVEVLCHTEPEPPHPGFAGGEVRMPIQARAGEWLKAALAAIEVGRVVVADYAVPHYPVEPARRWLRTYTRHGDAGDPLREPGFKDITADVDIGALERVCPSTDSCPQAVWLRRHGIDVLVDEGRAYWAAHAGAPDLAAIAMRSRVSEAEALLDPLGLGGFMVMEWVAHGPEAPVTR